MAAGTCSSNVAAHVAKAGPPPSRPQKSASPPGTGVTFVVMPLKIRQNTGQINLLKLASIIGDVSPRAGMPSQGYQDFQRRQQPTATRIFQLVSLNMHPRLLASVQLEQTTFSGGPEVTPAHKPGGKLNPQPFQPQIILNRSAATDLSNLFLPAREQTGPLPRKEVPRTC